MGGILDVIRGRSGGRVSQKTPTPGDAPADDKNANAYVSDSGSSSLSLEERNEKEISEHPDSVTADAQLGQQKAEAAALVWSKTAVRATYAWIWICFFMLALQQSILSNVMYYAYADFSSAPEITTAYILAAIIGGVLKLPIAKTLNLWGRAEGFLVFVAIYLLGMIVIASCNGANGFAAGYTLYWIGYDAIYFIMDVFVADTSGLRNRAFAFAFVSTPFICTAFTGPLAAQSFLQMTTWRWAIGAFCIIMFFVFTPLAIVFKFFEIKARKQGLFKREPSGRSIMQSIVHHCIEFDVVGAFLLMAAFVLFLLPFSLSSYGVSGYKSATFISMVVIGFLLFFVFAAWEKFWTRSHFIRWELFKKPTVLGACILAAVLYYSFYAWESYFYYFVMVVYDLNVANTGYMTQIYNIGSCFWGVVFGVYVRYTKHFKYACLFFGLPLMFLGAGLMIHFRGQDADIGYIIMCQIFIAVAGGTLVIGEDMAVMASADRDGVPMMLAILGLSSSLGGAIGYAVAAAIYTNTFPTALIASLPAESQADWATIYAGGSASQLLYPVGSSTRDAINYAWGYSQKYNAISATAVLTLAIPAIAIWKNYNVDKKQNKGTLI
ncbi:major facilitator superfamily domain-containing protein [Truncatella angustata]|uniref:Major facilitator superfamily domain-containing protein n=1 Tax=Truncatella angustata TaxID=152316 RepID=A0A9P8UVS2_9PEZI|nr:major facilitator superfamily domain-containing protein [Truncatella angustata]KAH6659122.1 major facilitator superfamily domain-containing protein [Truncatella angustata]